MSLLLTGTHFLQCTGHPPASQSFLSPVRKTYLKNIFLCPHLNFVGNGGKKEEEKKKQAKKRGKRKETFVVKLNSLDSPYTI